MDVGHRSMKTVLILAAIALVASIGVSADPQRLAGPFGPAETELLCGSALTPIDAISAIAARMKAVFMDR